MGQSCSIETIDRSGRWYLTPGAKSIYDLRVRNDANSTIDCSLVLEDPVSGVSVEPTQFALRGHEVRTVTVTVAADAPMPRSQRVLLTLRDSAGAQLASFEHPLIITGGSDCNISLAWKDALVEQGAVKGFELTCSLRSQSDGPTAFALSFTPHPSLTFGTLEPLTLEPGESKELTIPVRWNSTVKDAQGINHPAVLEVGVPVSNGRRSSRLRWDAIEAQLQPFYWNNVLAAVHAAPAARNGEKTANADAGGQTPPEQPAAASAAVATQPDEEKTSSTNGASNGTSNGTTNGHAKLSLPEAAEELGLPLFTGKAPEASAFDEAPAAEAAPVVAAAVASSATTPVPAIEAPLTPPPLTPPPLAPRPEFGVSAMRTPMQPQAKKRIPPGLLIGALATVSLAIAAAFFRPPSTQPAPPSTGPVVLASPLAAGSFHPQPATAPPPSQSAHKNLNAHARPATAKTPQPVAQPSPQVSAAIAAPAATPAPQQVAHTQPPPRRPVSHIVVQPVRQIAAAPAPRRSQLAAAPTGPVVALGGVEAFYGARGRAVRVNWSAAEQTAANIQLIDNRGTTVNSITVRGGRRSVLLYLPPRYRGAITVQLTSTGRLGERVAQTAFLPPFGN